MYKIFNKKIIAPDVTMTEIFAPKIAEKCKPGQFVILRLYEEGERIPLTIADSDPEKGTITVISQRVGKSTAYLEDMPKTEGIIDVVGPLGRPTHIENYGHVVCIGGGIGIAPVHPIAKGLKQAGNRVTSILGARTKDLLILEEHMRKVSDALYISTDDGSYARKGFVTDVLKDLVDNGEHFDLAVVIGPVPMMKAMTKLTKELNIPTIVSLNALMVDGTGMCGACRVTVDGKTKFTCVDGPEFDGHKVDFDELMHRLNIFIEFEARAREQYKLECENPDCVKKRAFDGKE
ncbi:MAG TPA: sulfide/dihydroorotate dehydrogenase-like FAD/NAD-binding protein [bacterium]|nr:sulfide/dihydroorotate dehydrogenase-like FAD/NAD-binding protein [bacterium]